MHRNTQMRCIEIAGDEPLVFADGYDAAIIGVCWRESQPCIVYDLDRIVAILVKRDGMSQDGALEFFEFNIADAWLGEGTLIFLKRI